MRDEQGAMGTDFHIAVDFAMWLGRPRRKM